MMIASVNSEKTFVNLSSQMVLTLPYFYSLAAALYINTCLVVAAVR